MSNHHTANNQAIMETSPEVNRGEKSPQSIAQESNPQESLPYLLKQKERAHQQNKTGDENENYETMKSYETTNSQSSDSYETQNYTTIQKKYQTSEECKFWNNGQCTKQNCKYQHFSLKHLVKQNNPEINLSPNEAIQLNELIIIEITELKYVPIDQIEQIITQQLNSDTKKRLIKIAITNKRRHKKLIQHIKFNKQIKNQKDDVLNQDWKEIINNLDEIKNNNKQISSSKQNKKQLSNQLKEKERIQIKTKPITPGQQPNNYNQFKNNKQIIQNIKASNENNMNAQTTSEEENNSNQTSQTIQGREQGRLAQSLGINSERDVRNLFIANENYPERILSHNGEDLFIELNKPSGKLGYIQMAQTYSTDKTKIIFKENLEINETVHDKLIARVKYRRESDTFTKLSNSDRENKKFTKITFYINKKILTYTYFQNIKAYTQMENLIPTIRYYNRCCAGAIEQSIERWVAEREPELIQVMKKEYVSGTSMEDTLSYYLIPKTGMATSSRKIGYKKAFSYQYRPQRISLDEPTKTIVFVMKILSILPTRSSKGISDIIFPQKKQTPTAQ